jgi:hypothetical protein
LQIAKCKIQSLKKNLIMHQYKPIKQSVIARSETAKQSQKFKEIATLLSVVRNDNPKKFNAFVLI